MKEFLDLRIIKTRRVLIDAFFDILKTKVDQKPIKVVDICNKAKISSITFYKHFDNKIKLLEYCIKDQLINKLPIPIKLKPKNLKHLIFYLIQFFENFCKQNSQLIFSCYESKNKMHKYYFDALIKTIELYVFNELKIISSSNTFMEINIWTKTIVGGLFNLFISRTISQRKIESQIIFNSLNKMINSLFII